LMFILANQITHLQIYVY